MFDSTTKNGHAPADVQGSPSVKDRDDFTDIESLKKFEPTETPPGGGLYYNWGIQAFTNLFLGKAAVKRLSKLIPHTLVPIIKLCSGNSETIDEAYNIILGYRESGKFFESPQEKYRKIYGNFVRELEWSCFELRKYFTKRAYEDLIINSTAIYINEVLGPFIKLLNNMMLMSRKHSGKLPDFVIKIMTVMTKFWFEHVMNITGWLVGDVKITEFDFKEGTMVMEVVDCLLLHAPRMKSFPEEACLLGCKGACEKVLQCPMKMTLDARLPETTCEIRSFIVED